MHHKSSDKFYAGECNRFFLAGFVILCRKGHIVIVNLHDSGVCDGDAIGITTKIFDCVAITVKGFLDFNVPVQRVELILQLIPVMDII